jgi:hypothetical protein
MMKGKESGRSGSPAGSEPTSRDSTTYHLAPILIPVRGVLDPIHSLVLLCSVLCSVL